MPKIAGMIRDVHFRGIIAFLVFFSSSCKSEKKEEIQFYYYPEKNVYYDPAKKAFWYSLNGAKSWSTFTNNNAVEPVTLGEKVVLEGTNAEVYKDNEKHRRVYAGKLYAISTDAANLATAVPEATERKVEPKRKLPAGRKAAATKPKNNLGKFIDKLFGKNR